MTFTYQEFSEPSYGELADAINAALNGFNPKQLRSAKIAISNAKNTNLRGVIFHCQDGEVDPSTLQHSWTAQIEVTKNNPQNGDCKAMYNRIQKRLNSTDLSPAQRYHSRLVMSAELDGSSCMVLHYRNSKVKPPVKPKVQPMEQ